MTSAPARQHTPTAPYTAPQGANIADDHEHPRLRLKPRAAAIGFVDGGWWPRSRDLAAELPALLAVVAVRLGRVEHVSYHLTDWGPTAHKIEVDGAIVRLAGYRTQHPATIDLISDAQQITLLVVPPEEPERNAHRALTAAGARDNTDSVEDLLDPTALQRGDLTR